MDLPCRLDLYLIDAARSRDLQISEQPLTRRWRSSMNATPVGIAILREWSKLSYLAILGVVVV